MHKAMVGLAQAKLPSFKVENALVDTMATSMAYICMGVMEAKTDAFEKRYKKLTNFHNYLAAENAKQEAQTPEGMWALVDEAKTKRPYVYEMVKKVPMSELLFLAEIKPKTASRNPDLKRDLQIALCIICVWIDRVLKEHYRFNKNERIEVFSHIANWINSYRRKFTSNKGIIEQYVLDLNYDLEKGEFVDA